MNKQPAVNDTMTTSIPQNEIHNNSQQIVNNADTSSSIIRLRAKLDIAPKGKQKGQIHDVTLLPLEKSEDGKNIQILKVDVQLEATSQAGSPFIVSKTYNILARGIGAFGGDMKSWMGSSILDEESAEFDKGTVVGKPLQVQIKHLKQGKQITPVIEAFLPPDTVTVSA